jgi:hypothetical protein
VSLSFIYSTPLADGLPMSKALYCQPLNDINCRGKPEGVMLYPRSSLNDVLPRNKSPQNKCLYADDACQAETLKMETVCFTETVSACECTQRHNPEEQHRHIFHREKHISHRCLYLVLLPVVRKFLMASRCVM